MNNNITILKNEEFTIFRNAFLLKIKEYVEIEKNLIYKPLRILILHHNDLDGIFPMVIAKRISSLYSFIKIDDASIDAGDTDKFIQALNDNDEEIKNKINFNSDINIAHVDNILECYDAIFIVDLNVREEKTFNIINNLLENTHVTLLDHHQYPELNQFNWAWVNVSNDDNIVCGTSLFYEYIKPLFNHNEILDKYVSLVSDWDTFNWKKTNNIDALNLSKVFSILNDNIDSFKENYFIEFIYKYIFEYNDDIKNQFNIFIKIYDNQLNENYNNYLNTKIDFKNDKLIMHIGFCPLKYISLVADKIYSNDEKDSIVIGIDVILNRISLRTNSYNINLKDIAEKLFNGGGHAKASGGSLNEKITNMRINLLTDILSDIIIYIK